MRKKDAKAKAVMELSKAVAYLRDLAASLEAGGVTVPDGETDLRVTPEDVVKVTLKATRKGEKESVAVKLSWRKAEERASDGDEDTEAETSAEALPASTDAPT
jgi:amphi-Trp domain-containing protein